MKSTLLCTILLAALTISGIATTPLLGQAPAASQPIAAPPPESGIAPRLKGRTVEEVRIIGNEQVPTAVIRNVIRTREGQPFDPATVEEDYQRVFDLKKFANVEARVEPTATGVIVIFAITEQKQVKAIRFVGNLHADAITLKDVIDVKVGQSLDPFRISLSRQAIEKYYRDHNFPYAHVEVDNSALTQRGQVIFNITEGPSVRIRRVRILGNHSFSDEKLKGMIQTKSWIWIFRKGNLDPEALDEDIATLRQFYQDHGFFDVRVGRKLAFSPDQSEVMVTFVIDEGPRYIIRHLEFHGLRALSEETLRRNMKDVEGAAYDLDLIHSDIRKMVDAYSPFGFIYAQDNQNPQYLHIIPGYRFYHQAGKVDLIYDIHEGEAFRMGRIFIRGNSKAQDKVYLRQLHVYPGQVYNSGELQNAIDRLKATRIVSNVTITPIGNDPHVRDVLVEVQETQTAQVMFGAGVTSNAGILGNISYEQHNFDIANIPSSWGELFSNRAFTGAGQYFRAEFQPGTEFTQARISFQEPFLFDQPYSFGGDVYYSTIAREHYEEVREGGKVSFGKLFNPEWSARISLRGDDVIIRDIDHPQYRSFEILAGKGHHTITSAGIDIRRDTTDSPLLATKGSTLDLSYEYDGALGGQYSFQKVEGDWALHKTVAEDLRGRKTTLTFRSAVGFIYGGNAPFFERFYAGGLGSVRGFLYRGISPRDGIGNDPIGGDFTLSNSIELNFPLMGNAVRGVTFIDGGTVERDMKIANYRTSIGFGIRLTLPILGQVPLAIDFGVPLTRARLDNTQVVSFSLGGFGG